MSQPDASVRKRVEALCSLLEEQRLDVYLVPSTDEHQNEFVPAHALRREAMTGFTGSAGDVAICGGRTHLFVDSRYHLQAEQQTDPELAQVHKLGLDGELDLPGFLGQLESKHGALRVGLDPMLHSTTAYNSLARSLKIPESTLVPLQDNLVDRVWAKKPAPALTPIFALPEAVTGQSAAEKLLQVRKAMGAADIDLLVLSKLDEVAWITNLRARDIPHNPVLTAYFIVTGEAAVCFTDNPLDAELRKSLAQWIQFEPLERFPKRLPEMIEKRSGSGTRIWLDKNSTSQGVLLLTEGATLKSTAANPVVGLKAAKNESEIATSREAHIRAACAKIRSLSVLQGWMDSAKRVSEADYADMLMQEYAREEDFVELSFPTIAGVGANAAIVHYSTPDRSALLQEGAMLLIDSGVQIVGATTDDTRTVSLGNPTLEQRSRYSDVLRGHIRLAMQIFPEGTTGQMLDILARSALWNHGADYGHGTGHGVGAFLNVHEGPQSISVRGSTPLAEGMIVSNEPGYYQSGWGGIRLENLYVVEAAAGLPTHPANKPWFRFSTLTLIPFDATLIDWGSFSPEEQQWLAQYHRQVWDRVSPRLDATHRAWLEKACALPG